MKKTLITFVVILLSLVMYGCSSSDGAEGEGDGEKPKLTLGVTNWTSTVPSTKIVHKILEDMGYEIDEIEAEPGSVYTGMSSGDIDIFMDSWYPNQEQYIDRYSDSIESISTSYSDADSGMVVPEYMEDINDVADLKGKEDLIDNEMFAIGEGDPAMDNMEKMIDGYGLDIEMTNSSEAAMLAAAEGKMEDQEPVLFYGWRPHTMFNEHDLKILTNEDAEEGLFDGSEIHVIANNELEDKAPEAYEFLSDWSISLDDMEEMIAEIDDGEDPDDVTEEWIDNHQDEIEEMKED